MIEILDMGRVSRIKIHFTCDWCGCKFSADRADYSKKVTSWYKKNPDDTKWLDRYEYRTVCPICGGGIWADERDVEKWKYTDYGDGTESLIRIDDDEDLPEQW